MESLKRQLKMKDDELESLEERYLEKVRVCQKAEEDLETAQRYKLSRVNFSVVLKFPTGFPCLLATTGMPGCISLQLVQLMHACTRIS